MLLGVGQMEDDLDLRVKGWSAGGGEVVAGLENQSIGSGREWVAAGKKIGASPVGVGFITSESRPLIRLADFQPDCHSGRRAAAGSVQDVSSYWTHGKNNFSNRKPVI